jgi:hypothetical protein
MSNNTSKVRYNELQNMGVLSDQVPADMLAMLNLEIQEIIASDFKSQQQFNHKLLGHMKHEYDLSNCISRIEPYILNLVTMYDQQWNLLEHYDDSGASIVKYLKLTDLWVNIQKKHEFNPPHEHTGIASFVIWINIPYDLAAEEAYFPEVSGGKNANRTSKFTFHYSNVMGQHRHFMVEVDKNHEGTIILFPSKLNHSVNPFYTSDGYRISVSGNIRSVQQ